MSLTSRQQESLAIDSCQSERSCTAVSVADTFAGQAVAVESERTVERVPLVAVVVAVVKCVSVDTVPSASHFDQLQINTTRIRTTHP